MQFFVAGLVNLETVVRVDEFGYASVRYAPHGITSAPSGVGLNVALALHTLGAEVNLCAFVGEDATGEVMRKHLERSGLNLFLEPVPAHPQSVVLVSPDGQRAIHTDLKDLQARAFTPANLERALHGADAALICNLNASRPALHLARTAGIPIYTDLHAIRDLENPYDTEFLECAQVVCFSAEHLNDPVVIGLEMLRRHANIRTVVIGAGERGAWLLEHDRDPHLEPAVPNPNVLSTVGAGDALCSSFAYFHAKTGDARFGIARAVRFASHKVGFVGGSSGFVGGAELEAMMVRS
jgi:ribokinase